MLALFMVSKWKRFHPTDLMTVSHPTLTSLVLLGDTGGTQGNTKADVGVVFIWRISLTVCRPAILGVAGPTAASHHAVQALFWANRIANCTLGISTVKVAAPFQHVPMHVI
jgi:hypothetical protein